MPGMLTDNPLGYIRPDSAYITELIGAARDEFDYRDRQDEVRDQLFWQENPIPHPSHVDFEPVHMGVAAEVVTRVKGIMDDFPEVQVANTSMSGLTISRATKVEDFANAIYSAMEDDADVDTWDLILEDIIRYGRGYDTQLYVPHNRSNKAKGYPEQGEGEKDEDWQKRYDNWALRAKLPLAWKHLGARNTFVWRDDEGICEALVVELRRASDVLQRYDSPLLRKAIDSKQRSRLDPVLCGHYWNPKWGAYWISDSAMPRVKEQDDTYSGVAMLRMSEADVVNVFENPYGHVPIVETSGITTSSNRSDRRQISIFDHMIHICKYLDQLVSQKATAVRTWAWPTPYLKNLGINGQVYGTYPTGQDGRPLQIEVTPGKMVTLLPGEEIGWLVVPENGAGSDSLIQLIKGQADLLGITSAVFSGEALGSNGYLYNSVLNAIRSKYSPVVKHVKRSHRQRVQNLLRIIEMHGEPLHVFNPGDGDIKAGRWFSIAPKDVEGHYYQIAVAFEDHLPTDDAADMALYLQSTEGDNPALDRNSAREKYLRDKSPERTQERIWAQKFTEQPPVQEFLMARAMKRAGIVLDEEEEEGNPLNDMTPEQLAMLPPALQQALGAGGGGAEAVPGAGGAVMPNMTPNPEAAGTGYENSLAAPTSMGGVPGAPATPYIPGATAPLVPPAQTRPAGGPPSRPSGPSRRTGGRAKGQSKAPASQPRASKP